MMALCDTYYCYDNHSKIIGKVVDKRCVGIHIYLIGYKITKHNLLIVSFINRFLPQ